MHVIQMITAAAADADKPDAQPLICAAHVRAGRPEGECRACCGRGLNEIPAREGVGLL